MLGLVAHAAGDVCGGTISPLMCFPSGRIPIKIRCRTRVLAWSSHPPSRKLSLRVCTRRRWYLGGQVETEVLSCTSPPLDGPSPPLMPAHIRRSSSSSLRATNNKGAAPSSILQNITSRVRWCAIYAIRPAPEGLASPVRGKKTITKGLARAFFSKKVNGDKKSATMFTGIMAADFAFGHTEGLRVIFKHQGRCLREWLPEKPSTDLPCLGSSKG